RKGECRRISGARTTEYPAQLTTFTSASASPRTLLEKPPLPAATKPTPAKAAAAASQKRLESRSMPNAEAIRPVKIGSAPRISATVEAEVSCTEVTKHTWLTKIISPPSATRPRSERGMRNDRSRRQVTAQNSTVAAQ